MRHPALVLLAVCLAVCGSACFELPRSAGVTEGQVRFTVRDSAGAPVEGAVVTVDGAVRMTVSSPDGLVSLEGLVPGDYVLRVGVEDDGVAGFDRAAVLTGSVERTVVQGQFTAPVEILTSDLPSDVVLAAVGNVSLTLNGCPVTHLCRAVAFRDVTVARDGHVVSGVVEAGASGRLVGVGGNLQILGLTPGAIHVAAFAWPRPVATAPLQQMIAATRDVSDFVVGDVDVVAGDTATLTLTLAPIAETVSTSLALGGEVADLERAAGEVSFDAPQAGVSVGVGSVSGAIFNVDAPVGVFDVRAQLDAGLTGVLFHAVVVPGIVGIGPLEVSTASGCRRIDTDNDCDEDGVIAGEDDDDDRDGQPDAEEPADCLVPGLGTDLDRDCLCDVADPFPDCASNDPVACDLVELPDCSTP